MQFFLRYVNPGIAVAILALCIWAAISDPDMSPLEIQVSSIWRGGFATYFVAKGLFCALAVFLLGKTLEQLQSRPG